MDGGFARISGETHYLWRAVDHEGEVIEVFVTKRQDRKAALKFLKKTIKRYCRPKIFVPDKLRSYRAAMKVIGNEARQETGRWLNNRAGNSHQPFRRRERAMASDLEEPDPAGKLLSARRSKCQHRALRGTLQSPPLSREPEEPDTRGPLLRTRPDNFTRTRKDQTKHIQTATFAIPQSSRLISTKR